MIDIQKIRSLYGKTALLDNNILNDFIELGCLGVLEQVFSALEIPTSILETELILEGHREMVDESLLHTSVSFQAPESYELFMTVTEKYPTLTDQDVQMVVIAKERAILCTSNERAINRACEEFGVDCTGTIGILCCAREHGIWDQYTFSYYLRKLVFEGSCWLSTGLKNSVFSHYHIPDRPLSQEERPSCE